MPPPAYRTLPQGTLTAAFCYRDEMAHRDCRTVLRFDGGRWSALPEEALAEVTVTCRQGDLASLLMASCGLEGMVRLGAVAVPGPLPQHHRSSWRSFFTTARSRG